MLARTHVLLMMLFCPCSVALAAEPKLDRFGDPLPEGAFARLGSLHLRHEEAVLTAAFTADGKTLAACDANGISFWDPTTGKCVRRVPLKNASPGQMRRFSNDGKVLMVVGFDKVLHFVNAVSGTEQGTLNHAQCGPIRGWPELSRDGKIVAAVHRASIALWDVAGGILLHEFKDPALAQGAPHGMIALTPDGKQMVLPHVDGSLHLVDVADGKEVRAFEMPPSRTNVPPPFRFPRLALSPDGRYLAFGGLSTPLTVCELTTGKRLHQLAPSQGLVSGLAFTPNGRFLAVDQLNEVRLFGVLSGKEMRKLPKKMPMTSMMLVFSPDGRTLASFPGGYRIDLWDVVAQRRLHSPDGHEAAAKALAFFPDGKRLVSADQAGEVRVWDIASYQTLAQRTYHNNWFASLTVDRDGETVRFPGNDSSAYRWDPRSGREEVRQSVVAGQTTSSLALSPDGRSLAIVVFKGGAPQKGPAATELRLYDLKTNKAIVLPRSPGQSWVGHMTFAPDSRRLAVCCYDGVLRLWDRDTGKLVREFKRETPVGHPIHPIFAADGRSLLVSMDGRVRIREIAGGGDRLQIPPVPNSLFSLAYSPDARFVASGQRDGSVFVYSAVSGKKLAQWQSKQGYVFSLAFSRDGRLLASGGANGTILIWKVPEDDSVSAVQTAKEALALWLALGDSDAAAANRALAGLAAAPPRTLPLFKERLASIDELIKPKVARWIAELDDDSFKIREKATRELARTGQDAADALRHALDNNPSPEAKRRIEDLLSRLKMTRYSQRLRALRVIEVLERIGTPQAKELLHELAGKPLSDELKEEVQASLRRMGERSSERKDKSEPRP